MATNGGGPPCTCLPDAGGVAGACASCPSSPVECRASGLVAPPAAGAARRGDALGVAPRLLVCASGVASVIGAGESAHGCGGGSSTIGGMTNGDAGARIAPRVDDLPLLRGRVSLPCDGGVRPFDPCAFAASAAAAAASAAAAACSAASDAASMPTVCGRATAPAAADGVGTGAGAGADGSAGNAMGDTEVVFWGVTAAAAAGVGSGRVVGAPAAATTGELWIAAMLRRVSTTAASPSPRVPVPARMVGDRGKTLPCFGLTGMVAVATTTSSLALPVLAPAVAVAAPVATVAGVAPVVAAAAPVAAAAAAATVAAAVAGSAAVNGADVAGTAAVVGGLQCNELGAPPATTAMSPAAGPVCAPLSCAAAAGPAAGAGVSRGVAMLMSGGAIGSGSAGEILQAKTDGAPADRLTGATTASTSGAAAAAGAAGSTSTTSLLCSVSDAALGGTPTAPTTPVPPPASGLARSAPCELLDAAARVPNGLLLLRADTVPVPVVASGVPGVAGEASDGGGVCGKRKLAAGRQPLPRPLLGCVSSCARLPSAPPRPLPALLSSPWLVPRPPSRLLPPRGTHNPPAGAGATGTTERCAAVLPPAPRPPGAPHALPAPHNGVGALPTVRRAPRPPSACGASRWVAALSSLITTIESLAAAATAGSPSRRRRLLTGTLLPRSDPTAGAA